MICRIFQKTIGGKKTHISGLVRLSSYGACSLLPPLMESSSSPPPYNSDPRNIVGKTGSTPTDMTCFSDPMEEDQKSQQQEAMIESFNPLFPSPHNNNFFSRTSCSLQNSFFSNNNNQIPQSFGNLQFPDSVLMQEPSVLSILIDNQAPEMKGLSKAEYSQETGLRTEDMAQRSFDDQDDPSSSAGPVDLGCLWNY